MKVIVSLGLFKKQFNKRNMITKAHFQQFFAPHLGRTIRIVELKCKDLGEQYYGFDYYKNFSQDWTEEDHSHYDVKILDVKLSNVSVQYVASKHAHYFDVSFEMSNGETKILDAFDGAFDFVEPF